MEAFKQAIRSKPDFASAHYGLGLAYHELERYSESIAAFQQALLLDPNDALTYYGLGITYEQIEEYQKID